MSRRISEYLFLILSFAFAGIVKSTEQGHLLIIGGAGKPTLAIQEFVRLCSKGSIVVITAASGVPQLSGPDAVKLFLDAGAEQVVWMDIPSQEVADSDSTINRINQSKGLFFTGGVQTRFMDRIGSTRAEAAIRRLYFESRGVVGGTSAGAAVMSAVMITGNELVNQDSTQTFATLQHNNIETARGLGLMPYAIVDQHFSKRKRHLRLISAVLDHPKLVGIGIDESTAILVSPNKTIRVFGEGPVFIYDARRARKIQVNQSGTQAGQRLRMDILVDGDQLKID